MNIQMILTRDDFRGCSRELLRLGAQTSLSVELARNAHGIEIVRLSNHEGWIDILPFMGAMIWDACFLGVRLGMKSHFAEPRPAHGILGTYGCLLYHAGVLRNGNPGPDDDHALHGEAPCAPMDAPELVAGTDEHGAFLRLICRRDHAEGFGAHYLATHAVTLRSGETEFDVTTQVENRGGRAMDLMYMAHPNFAFTPGARILQPVPWTPAHMHARVAVPSHVDPSPKFLARLTHLAAEPAALEVLDPTLCDPEQVFYLTGLRTDPAGWVHLALRQPRGDGFALSYPQADFSYLVRWLYCGPDEQVAGFALPATCEPEGYTAERRKGNVQSLAPGEIRRFPLRMGYLTPDMMDRRAALIAGSSERSDA